VRTRAIFCTPILALAALAQSAGPAAAPAEQSPDAAAPKMYTVTAGTKIPLQVINSISTKTAAVGDRVYLQTNFPVLADGRIVVPPGSYVTGTVTQVKRAGKIKGHAELYVRFDSLTLPNGVTRDFRAALGGLDGSNPGKLDRTEGKVEGDGNKAGDTMKVGEAAGWGTMIGGVAGRSGTSAGIGAAAGAAAGLAGVLMTRGPDAMIERGATIEMVIDRSLKFSDEELAGLTPARPALPAAGPPRRPAAPGGHGSHWPVQ